MTASTRAWPAASGGRIDDVVMITESIAPAPMSRRGFGAAAIGDMDQLDAGTRRSSSPAMWPMPAAGGVP